MERGWGIAWICLREAVRDFRLREYAPFGWILAVQLLYVLFALNLGAAWAMGPMAALAGLMRAEATLHYPRFFIVLPQVFSLMEAVLYTLPGSVLIPLALIRILEPIDPALGQRQGVGARLKQAVPPTLVASMASAALLLGWQWVIQNTVGPAVRGFVGGFMGLVGTWIVSILGAYAVGALLLYVPIVAVQPNTTFGRAIGEGVVEGVKLVPLSILFVYGFTLPAMPFLLLTQLRAGYIVERMRPEIVVWLWAAYAILLSLATYLTYAAAVRLHLAKGVKNP